MVSSCPNKPSFDETLYRFFVCAVPARIDAPPGEGHCEIKIPTGLRSQSGGPLICVTAQAAQCRASLGPRTRTFSSSGSALWAVGPRSPNTLAANAEARGSGLCRALIMNGNTLSDCPSIFHKERAAMRAFHDWRPASIFWRAGTAAFAVGPSSPANQAAYPADSHLCSDLACRYKATKKSGPGKLVPSPPR